MQIYLHSRHNSRKSAKITFFIFTTIALTSALILAVSAFISTKGEQFILPERAIYLSTASTNQGSKSDFTNDTMLEETPKMNNLKCENSNLYKSNVSTGKFRIDEIKLIGKSGNCVQIPLEEYVFGCLLAEMPLDFHPQALMAQAVAARTYVAEKILCGASKHKGGDVCTSSSCCQSYCSVDEKSYSSEYLQKAKDAVNATKGMIAVFDGKPINAVYHASSGYCTLDSKDVWGGEVPYLKSVTAPKEEAEITKREYTYSKDAFCRILKGSSNESEAISVFASSDSSFGDGIELDSVMYPAHKVAKALNLQNSYISLSSNGESITVTASGYGHRVGMSQHGANLLAEQGKSCTEILSYYYSGISFAFLSY